MIIKNHYRLGLSILLVSLAFAWYFWHRQPDNSLTAIQARGTLRVGLDASFPPFETMTADGQIIGLDVDIAQALAQDLGVKAEFVNIGFDGLYDALLARRVDLVISGLPNDPRWTEDVAYTHNYFNAGQMLITRAENTIIKQTDDLAQRKVAIEWGSQADMEARQLQQTIVPMQLIRQSTATEAIETLLNDQADAAIVDAVTGVSALPRGLKIITYLTDEWYAAAVHLQDRELLAAMNESLTKLNKSGQMAQLQAKWLK